MQIPLILNDPQKHNIFATNNEEIQKMEEDTDHLGTNFAGGINPD
jgi:hypothetical protein